MLPSGSTSKKAICESRLGKPSVKAELAIYDHVLDISAKRMSVSLILGFKLDFSYCVNMDGFLQIQSHICT